MRGARTNRDVPHSQSARYHFWMSPPPAADTCVLTLADDDAELPRPYRSSRFDAASAPPLLLLLVELTSPSSPPIRPWLVTVILAAQLRHSKRQSRGGRSI